MMQLEQMSARVPCYQCGYDLRAHGQDGVCPECGIGVAESRRLAALPRRPAWSESDPAWRRRIVAGVWLLVLLPLMEAMNIFGWASRVPVPHVFNFCDPRNTLDGRLISYYDFFCALMFCMGMALLFSHERGRRPSRLDWTGRWGVICCYIVLLLYATRFLQLTALVLAGVAALFQSIPLKYQPGSIDLLVRISSAYLRYGPSPKLSAFGVQIVFSAITVLLGTFPLYNAVRSCASKLFAVVLLAPLALFSLIQIVQGVRSSAGQVGYDHLNIFFCSAYFWPEAFLLNFADASVFQFFDPLPVIASTAECLKWCIVLAIAIWLSTAQFLARPKRATS